MSELQKGKLKVTARKKGSPLIQVDIDGTLFNIGAGQLSGDIEPEDGIEVEFEREAGQPRRIRKAGQEFVPPAGQSAQSSRQSGRPRSRRDHGSRQQSRQQHSQPASQPMSDATTNSGPVRRNNHERNFHNPYNFIPAPPRRQDDPDLGDHAPVSHDRFHSHRFTGRLTVKMTAVTPLLVPDVERMVEDDNTGHKTFPLRVDESGLPIIPSSSVRGMLRSAYEAITNSRFGRFSRDHQKRLQYREPRRPFRKVDYPVSPWDLLPESLRPATKLDDLSPADRVFGWVNADGVEARSGTQERVAWRGFLRVGPVRCLSARDDAVDEFDPPGVPLAILGQPKPQQGRFYVAKSPQGEAQDDGLKKVDAGYQQEKGLRGRKVYPHHGSLPPNHWDNPQQDRTQQSNQGHYQEYRRPRDENCREQQDDQNRSIRGWVKPGAAFEFEIQVENLSQVELGALLWLLSLPDGHYFRFGGGKPLGFGSVRLELKRCDLCTGQNLKVRYTQWQTEDANFSPDQAIEAFKDAVVRAHGNQDDETTIAFDDISFINAFLASAQGFPDDKPIHYRRATHDGNHGPPNPAGESFKWFVANDKDANARYALPGITEKPNDVPLPTLRDPQSGRTGGGGDGRGRGGGRGNRGGGRRNDRRRR